jgi:hypothetical protein
MGAVKHAVRVVSEGGKTGFRIRSARQASGRSRLGDLGSPPGAPTIDLWHTSCRLLALGMSLNEVIGFSARV